MNRLPELILEDGVYIDPNAVQRFADFEKAYLIVREKEGRVLTSEQIKKLPQSPNEADASMWALRRKTISRFLKYLQDKKKSRILEVGCGNGFFSNLLSEQGHAVSAVDVNLTELKLAAKTFNSGTKWYYLDVMESSVPGAPFDLVVFNASFHYFGDPEKLIAKCMEMLTEKGEIHILDSPFYTAKQKEPAHQRSADHFEKMGCKDMSNFYHHHDSSILNKFGVKCLYAPKPLLNKLLRVKDSPFHWFKLPKQSN